MKKLSCYRLEIKTSAEDKKGRLFTRQYRVTTRNYYNAGEKVDLQ